MKLTSLNWIYKYGLNIVSVKNIEKPVLMVPPDLYDELKEEWSDYNG